MVYGPPETSERYTLYPDTTDALGVHVTATEWATAWDAAAPLPEREMVLGEFVALLAIVMLPLKLDAVSGVKMESNVADWPGDKIKPADTPVTV